MDNLDKLTNIYSELIQEVANERRKIILKVITTALGSEPTSDQIDLFRLYNDKSNPNMQHLRFDDGKNKRDIGTIETYVEGQQVITKFEPYKK